jgi:hypothetical protein
VHGAEADERLLGIGLAEKVCHPHPVECSARDALGRVQISMQVEVKQSDSLIACSQRPGNRAELDRAIASENESDLVCCQRLGNARGHVLGRFHDGGPVLRPRVLAVGAPAEAGNVAAVLDP